MRLKVFVEGKELSISIGQGYGDFRWLALAAAHLYGKVIYPAGKYLPIHLYIQRMKGGAKETLQPHPRRKINSFLQSLECKAEDISIFVRIRNADHKYRDYEQAWQKNAFGEGRSLMQLYFRHEVDKLSNRKDYKCKACISYTMNEEVINQFIDSTDFKPRMEIVEQLVPKVLSKSKLQSKAEFQLTLHLPFGQVKHHLLFEERDERSSDQKKPVIIEYNGPNKTTNYTYINNPNILSKKEIQELVRNEMKMPQHLSRQLQVQELQSKKRAGSNYFCCFTGDKLWQIIQQRYDKQLDISLCDQPIKDKISISISKNLNKLYQIFFQYVIIYYQQKNQKEDLCITYQDVMHFLKFYQILPDSASVHNFFQIFNEDDIIVELGDTLDLDKGVKFPDFIMIVLRVVHFVNTTHIQQGVTFDAAVEDTISKIIKVESNEDEFNEFHKNMRENVKLINFLRQNSQKLVSIFVERLYHTPHVSASKYHMLFEDVKSLVADTGFDIDSLDQVIQQCYKQLFALSAKYRNFEGLYFYEFLQVMQWLSHVLTGLQNEDMEEDSIEVLINKMTYFLSQVYNESRRKK